MDLRLSVGIREISLKFDCACFVFRLAVGFRDDFKPLPIIRFRPIFEVFRVIKLSYGRMRRTQKIFDCTNRVSRITRPHQCQSRLRFRSSFDKRLTAIGKIFFRTAMAIHLVKLTFRRKPSCRNPSFSDGQNYIVV